MASWSLTAVTTVVWLLHLGFLLGVSFCRTSIILHILTQISIALSATFLSPTHLVAQNENGNNVLPVTLI